MSRRRAGRRSASSSLIKQGIEIETAKKMVKAIKDAKIKVQASDPGGRAARRRGRTATTCSRRSRFLRKGDYGLDLQFVNFRD